MKVAVLVTECGYNRWHAHAPPLFSGPGRWRVFTFVLVSLLVVAASDVTHGQTDKSPGFTRPSPDLTPAQVVRLQVESLRANDENDSGIAACFEFASPGNRSATGPLSRFKKMIRAGPYALMLAYTDAQFGVLEVKEDRARQQVVLAGGGKVITYMFYLSRQTQGRCNGCWMTDSVDVESIEQST